MLSLLKRNQVEILDSSGSNPATAYPYLWKKVCRLGSKPYFFKWRIQCDWSSSCSLFIIFFMTMKSRGFVGPDLLRTFFPPKPSYDPWKNDCAIACFLGVVYKQKSIEKYVLDLDFLVERHKLDMKQRKEQQPKNKSKNLNARKIP